MARFITEEDHAVIAEVVRRVMHDEFGTWRQDDDRGPTKAPDIYVAKVPDGGIPALDSEAVPPTPGSATCDLYRIIEVSAGAGTYELEEMTGQDKLVFNMATSAVDEADTPYVVIAKAKNGRWLVAAGLAGAGGGGDADCPCNQGYDDDTVETPWGTMSRVFNFNGVELVWNETDSVWDDSAANDPDPPTYIMDVSAGFYPGYVTVKNYDETVEWRNKYYFRKVMNNPFYLSLAPLS